MQLKLGLTPWRLDLREGIHSVCQQAVLAESWGYESLFLPEHHFSQDGAIPDPLLLLASIAAVTSKLRLGTTSYLLPLRHPILAAEQVAVLDQLSAGRVILGIGRGYAPGMFDAFDVDPRSKRKLFAKNLDIMLKAWEGSPLTSDSSATSIRINPLPVQKPHPPIYVAAFGPLALKQAGKLGFPYLASPMETKSRLVENYAKHRAACKAESIPLPTETPIMRSIFVSNDALTLARVEERLDREARSLVRRNGDTEMKVKPNDWAIVGSPSFLKDAIEEYVETLSMTQLVATRLRIGGVPTEKLAESTELVATTLLS